MKRIVRLQHLNDYWIELFFDNGEQGSVDLSHLAGKGVFSGWRDPANFHAASIGTRGELIWPDGVELCPDSLYLRATGKKPADVFPSLRKDPVHA